MKGETGGQAFPRACGQCGSDVEGMTLRDWFAGQAMSGIAERPGEGCDGYIAQRAKIAYQIADALIKARTQEGGSK